MEYFYLLALQKIKALQQVPTRKEWNVIAKLENYLTAESIEYISQRGFTELCLETRR